MTTARPAITPKLTTKDLSKMTGLSMDYFQRLARAGKIPCHRLGVGCRAKFFFDQVEFGQWWATQLRRVEGCQEARSASAGKSGTGASGGTARNSRNRLKQAAKRSLASVLAAGSTN